MKKELKELYDEEEKEETKSKKGNWMDDLF